MDIAHKKPVVNSFQFFNPIALRKTKFVCNFGLSECSMVNQHDHNPFIMKVIYYYSKEYKITY